MFKIRTLMRQYILLILLVLLTCGSSFANPSNSSVTVTIALNPDIRQSKRDGQQAIADFQLRVDSNQPTAAKLRVYADNLLAKPIEEQWVFDQVVDVSGSITVTVPIPLNETGDFSLRAIVFPVERATGEWNGKSASRSDLAYFRFGQDNALMAFNPLSYTHKLGQERSSDTEKTGLQDKHPHGQEIYPAPGQHPTESRDGLKLNAPKINIGEGVTTFLPEPGDRTYLEPPGPLKQEVVWGIAGLRSPTQAMPVKASASGNISVAGNSKSLTVAGKLTTNLNGKIVPLRYTKIDVYDHDTLSSDDFLGSAVTDSQGKYNVVVDNDDGIGGGGVDVYLYVHAQTSKIDLFYIVPDGLGDWTPIYYSWKSSTYDDINKWLAIIDFEITSNKAAAAIWSGASAAARLPSRTLRKVEVRYPPLRDGTNFINNIINIDSRHADSPETVGHEYAHAVMYQAYGAMPDESGGGHDICNSGSKGLAWSEGFANWYGTAAWDSTGDYYWHIGGPKLNFEKLHCGPLDASTGEARAAAWMWDLMDAPKDSNGGVTAYGRTGYSDNNERAEIVSTQKMINTLWDRKQNSIIDYWTDLQKRLEAAEKDPSVRISKYNYLINP